MRLDKFPILIHFNLKQITRFNQKISGAKKLPRPRIWYLFQTHPHVQPFSYPIHCVSKESSSRSESMNNWKHHSNRQSFISFVIAQHSPSLTHQKLIQLLHFSSLTILIYRKDFKGANANENVEWTHHVLDLFQDRLFWQYPNLISMLPCWKVVFTKAHILKLCGAAQNTEFKSSNSLSEFEKVVFIHIGVQGPCFLCGICHKKWQEYIRPVFVAKGKRIQKHNNRAARESQPRRKVAHQTFFIRQA